MRDDIKGNQVQFLSLKKINFEDIALKTTRITYTGPVKGKALDNFIKLREYSKNSWVLTKFILMQKGGEISVNFNIMMKKSRKRFFWSETQSSVAEILELLTMGRAANPPGDVTLIPESPVGGDGK